MRFSSVGWHVQALSSDPEVRVTAFETEAEKFEEKAVPFQLNGDTHAAAENKKVAYMLRVAADLMRENIKGKALTLPDLRKCTLRIEAGVHLPSRSNSWQMYAPLWLQLQIV